MSFSRLRVVQDRSPAAPEQDSDAVLDSQTKSADAASNLLEGLGERAPWAERLLVQRYAAVVERILSRILGSTAELDDLAQEVFVRVFDRVALLRDPQALGGFVSSITVFVAREAIRAKRRRWWLSLFAADQPPEVELSGVDPVAREAVRAFYEVVGKLPDDERIAFCLRYVEGMELSEIAAACETSLSTLKRRLRDAERRFSRLAGTRAELSDLMREGSRWPRHAS